MAPESILALLGFVTGCIGAVMGCLAYRRTGQFKALDLRLQLRTSLSTFETTLASITPLMHEAKRSRLTILAADGLGRSGIEHVFTDSWESDKDIVSRLAEKFGELNLNFAALKNDALERSAGELDRLSQESTRLLRKYQDCMKADDERRSQVKLAKLAMSAANVRHAPLKAKFGE